MRFEKSLFILPVILLMILSFIPGLPQAQERKIIASEVIRGVGTGKDYKYISINDRNFFLTPDVKIMDESGKSLTVSDLRPGVKVTIERIRSAGKRPEFRVIVTR